MADRAGVLPVTPQWKSQEELSVVCKPRPLPAEHRVLLRQPRQTDGQMDRCPHPGDQCQTAGLHPWERGSVWCLIPRRVWPFVVAAPGTRALPRGSVWQNSPGMLATFAGLTWGVLLVPLHTWESLSSGLLASTANPATPCGETWRDVAPVWEALGCAILSPPRTGYVDGAGLQGLDLTPSSPRPGLRPAPPTPPRPSPNHAGCGTPPRTHALGALPR